MHGAGAAFTAGALLQDAVVDLKRPFSGFDGLPERYTLRGAPQARAAATPLEASYQPRMGESGEDAGEQPARDVGLDGDPIGRNLFSGPGQVDQSPQSVASLAAQLQAQDVLPSTFAAFTIR